jgi:hypothetical protein
MRKDHITSVSLCPTHGLAPPSFFISLLSPPSLHAAAREAIVPGRPGRHAHHRTIDDKFHTASWSTSPATKVSTRLRRWLGKRPPAATCPRREGLHGGGVCRVPPGSLGGGARRRIPRLAPVSWHHRGACDGRCAALIDAATLVRAMTAVAIAAPPAPDTAAVDAVAPTRVAIPVDAPCMP